ncbi:MAG: S26 family signal peptidase [Planctomycetaceae bacterium]|jgi:signal peptidase I|nr:S26 family signal peptidase [Planctomycetaceae bacterium]
MNPSDTQPSSFRNIREIIESLAVALALAFFFKAFAAEAFVIPTGSMASTLMGRHKDVQCGQCGFPFQISASEESNDGTDRPRDGLPRVVAGTCPQCRYTMYVGADNAAQKTFLSFSGDRIFVDKSRFDFHAPQRWHVTVFRYPGKTQINYIKRLVGLENESIFISNGDIFVKKLAAGLVPSGTGIGYQIQRKPLSALQAMMRPVDDNDYVLPELLKLGWMPRWYSADNSWKRSEDCKSFDCTEAGEHWLTYRNVEPSSSDWSYLSAGKMPPQGAVNNPQLITDFVGYNSGITDSKQYNTGQTVAMRDVNHNGKVLKEHFVTQSGFGLGLNWVGDLALSSRITIQKPGNYLLFKLVKGGVNFLCRIDLRTGQAELSIQDCPQFAPVLVQTPLLGTGTFDVMFINCDEELRLVVNGKEITTGQGRYDTLCEPGGVLPRDRSPNELDLQPAAIGVQDAAVKVEHLKVQRDLYYIACNENSNDNTQCDLRYSPFHSEYPLTENTVASILSSPDRWGNFGKTNVVRFDLKDDEFLMLGDNSAKSKDSRLWTTDGIPCYVPRNLLIGEAVFVYWPHGLRIPGTNIALIPNVKKVRMIK